MNNEIITRKLIETAYSKQIKVHLNLTDGSWRNGYVKEVKPEFFMFVDRVNNEEPIFFLELKDVSPYLEVGK